ncbi:unnamed protein product [Cylindrotheca closterium]|uniref:Uncharacterized protein n=1 Tax=Cylindrotheca closterium TaxID=2856 RepID=A0AAD2GCE0_9STRA|nr:unnamed protein product [Cylindrotheca closterium]
MTSITDNGKKAEEVASGIPPWHAQLFIGSLLAISVQNLPSRASLDQVATIEALTAPVLPNVFSLKSLGIVRLSIAASIWIVMFFIAVISDGWKIHTVYKPQTKLKKSVIHMKGIRTFFPFTSWSWILLGLYFSINGYIALTVEAGAPEKIQPWMLRAASILFEISAPFALLVSAVIRYAIWPAVLKSGKPHALDSFRNQMMHNMNAVYALSEMALLGGPAMNFSHISLPCFVGCCYILFAWSAAHFLGKAGTTPGPQYQYFFLDTTLGKATTISLAVLLVVLMTFFAFFVGISALVNLSGGNLILNSLAVILVSSLVCKVKA